MVLPPERTAKSPVGDTLPTSVVPAIVTLSVPSAATVYESFVMAGGNGPTAPSTLMVPPVFVVTVSTPSELPVPVNELKFGGGALASARNAPMW